mmetsp:Transcript_18439/g.29251  ORF Transcript_18439/g.29251 Transcript_18439/m.29251 type:complete len:185 (-) Transcript_18439:130-684(-)
MCRKFGEIIDNFVKKKGLSVTRTYCGHGIGRMFHCAPNIPHYRRNKAVGKLKPGMVFTIEPMINMGAWKDKTWSFDNWTAVTVDGKRSAQFEHTVLVTTDGVEVLTARTPHSAPLWWQIEEAAAVETKETEQQQPQNNDASAPQPQTQTESPTQESKEDQQNENDETVNGNDAKVANNQPSNEG